MKANNFTTHISYILIYTFKAYIKTFFRRKEKDIRQASRSAEPDVRGRAVQTHFLWCNYTEKKGKVPAANLFHVTTIVTKTRLCGKVYGNKVLIIIP